MVKKAAPPLLTGRDLMGVFGLKPSPRFKEILQHIEEARLSGDRMDRKTALALVEQFLNEGS
jgi:hypothetical protein